ncbi:MAG: zinc-binding dehydrogenase [Dehalococcoidia bacterium]|nr:zinc-binding dehydrogenase [Dehalococcoidia bacterium]
MISRTMRAAVAVERGVVRCDEVEVPRPGPGDVLVRTRAASICGSDLHMVNTGWAIPAFPAMSGHPGHEAVGEVIESRSEHFSEGELVLTVPHIWNSRCFADYQVVDDAHVLKLDPGVDIDTVTLAQQLGTVVFAAKRLPRSLDGQTCLVVGQGSAGLFWDLILARLGAEKIISIEPLSWRRELGLQYGVDETIAGTGEAATQALMDLTGGAGADLVIEAVGSTSTLSQAFHLVRNEGRVVLFGLPESEDPVPFDYSQMFKSRADVFTVLGSQDEPGLTSYTEAVNLISSGELNVEPIISHRIGISEISRAFEIASERVDGAVKIGLTFD